MKEMQWNKCPHCGIDRYCTDVAMQIHIEDCTQRPSQSKRRPCPKCGGMLEKILPASWVCLNESCDYQLGVLNGGKLS